MSMATKAALSVAKSGKKLGPRSEETKRKIAAAHKGKKVSAETRAKQSAAKKGKPGPWAGIKRGPQSLKWRAAISAGNMGKPAYYPKRRYYYGGAALRSSWELLLAKAFDQRGIIWTYEPTRFDLGSQTYSPDFYLPEQDCFWEVKGWLGPQAKETVKLFREKYPEIPLIVATKEILAAWGIEHKQLHPKRKEMQMAVGAWT